jgi:hypothetical protein
MRRVRLIHAGREFTSPHAEPADVRRRTEAVLRAALRGSRSWRGWAEVRTGTC